MTIAQEVLDKIKELFGAHPGDTLGPHSTNTAGAIGANAAADLAALAPTSLREEVVKDVKAILDKISKSWESSEEQNPAAAIEEPVYKGEEVPAGEPGTVSLGSQEGVGPLDAVGSTVVPPPLSEPATVPILSEDSKPTEPVKAPSSPDTGNNAPPDPAEPPNATGDSTVNH